MRAVERDELDYGEGKTREQEARDSAAMLGAVMIAMFAFVAIVGLTYVFMSIIF